MSAPVTNARTFDRIGPDTDRVQALWDLAEDRAKKGTGDADGWLPFAMRRLGPAFLVADMGHIVTWDPPAALTSVSARWTCTVCGHSVLVREGQAYGSALREPCTAPAGREER